MQFNKLLIGLVAGFILAAGATVYAGQVTIPTAPSAGYVPVSNANGTYSPTFGISVATTTTTIWLDGNRTDSYTANGTQQYPFKTISAANAAVVAAGYPSVTYYMAPGTYTQQSLTMPNIPMVIHADGSSIIMLSGAAVGAGTITFPSDITFDDPVIFGNISFTNTSLTNPHNMIDPLVVGNVTYAGLATFTNGSIIDQNQVQFPFLSQTASSTLTVLPGAVANFLGSGVFAVINNQGFLNLNDAEQVVATSSRYAIDSSTAGSQLAVSGGTFFNYGTGGGINCANSAPLMMTNELSSFSLDVGVGTPATNAISCGNAYSLVSTYIASDFLGNRYYATGTPSTLSSFSQAQLSVEGNSYLNVLPNARTGFGTANPQTEVDILGTASTTNLYVAGLSNLIGGLTSYASTTIGNGTQAGGLTVSGGATTTGNQYVVGTITSGSSTLQRPVYPLQVFTSGASNAIAGISSGLDGGAQNPNLILQQWSGVSNGYHGDAITTAGAGDMDFLTSGYGPIGSEAFTSRLYIQNAGNAGFGSTTPTSNLSVQNNYGSTNATLFSVASSTASNGSTANTLFTIGPTITKDYGQFIVYPANSVSYGISTLANSSNGSQTIAGVAWSGNLTLQTPNVSGVAWPNQLVLNGSNGNVGVGTSTPFAQLSIATPNGSNGALQTLFAIASSTQQGATTTLFSVSNTGHIIASSTTPTLSSCGTSPSSTGDDTHGTVTVGATGTGCTITFATPFAADPVVLVTPETGSIVNTFSYTHSTTGIVVTQSGLGGNKFDYWVIGTR